MKFEEFVKEVMERADLTERAEAQDATRAVLETLSEHLTEGEALNFAAQLPPELVVYMQQPLVGGMADSFTLSQFFARVGAREGVNLLRASEHTRAVAEVLRLAVSPGAFEHLRDQLPADIRQVFQP